MAPTPDRLVDGARAFVSTRFRQIVSGESEPAWVTAMSEGDDAGYFGPGSAAWAVHGSLPTLVGGVRALLMQTLHPGALAGVVEHSAFETDALGRLARTTQWLTVTTFGDTASADRECARVRGIHRRVKGDYIDSAGDSVPYTATDPDLLRWVHLAFTDSFLSTHQVWGGPIPGGPDAYVREWAKAGELVGVDGPPRSVAELTEQLESYRPILRSDQTTANTVRFIRDAPLPTASRPAYALLFAGAVSTLDSRDRALLGLPVVPRVVAKPAVGSLLGGLRLALGNQPPSQRRATQRVERLA